MSVLQVIYILINIKCIYYARLNRFEDMYFETYLYEGSMEKSEWKTNAVFDQIFSYNDHAIHTERLSVLNLISAFTKHSRFLTYAKLISESSCGGTKHALKNRAIGIRHGFW